MKLLDLISKDEEARKAAWKVVGFVFWTLFGLAAVAAVLTWGWLVGLAVDVLAIINAYLGLALAQALGKKNAFFTIIDEGRAKGITYFGRAHECLMAFVAHRFAGEINPKKHYRKDSFWDVQKLTEADPRPKEHWLRDFIRHVLLIDLGGLMWVGIWPFYRVYTYPFRWTSLRGQLPKEFESKETGVKYKEVREKTLDYILVRQETYLLELQGVEDIDLIPVDIKIVWTIQIVNPFKALFRVRSWLETSTDRLMTYVRREFAAKSWREFQKILQKQFAPGESFEGLLQPILGEVEELYGARTVGIEIIDLTPEASFAQAARQVREAQADADAALENAKAIRTRAGAEADRVKAVFGAAQSFGADGVAMKLTEDIASKGNVVVVGQPGDFASTILGTLAAAKKKGAK